MKLYCRTSSVSDRENLQNNITTLDNWCHNNKLPLNANKCNVMSFYRKKSPLLFDYVLGGQILKRPDYIKDLEVFFDTNLSFSHHIDECLAGAYKSIGFVLRNSKDFKDISTLRLLLITFVIFFVFFFINNLCISIYVVGCSILLYLCIHFFFYNTLHYTILGYLSCNWAPARWIF